MRYGPFEWRREVADGSAAVVKGWRGDGVYVLINDRDEFSPGVAVAVLAPDEARSLIEALGAAIEEVERAG